VTWARPHWLEGVTSAVAALVALAVVHHDLAAGGAVAVTLAALATVALLRPLWAGLPPFVDRWLGLGVVLAASGTLACLHALTNGIPYAVLRLTELAAVGSASAATGMAVAMLASTHLRLAAEVAAQEQRVAQLERSALESRLAALSAQINPHFLFNTLNTLAEVVHEDEDLAEDLITDLASMMRYALRSSTRRVPLADELDTVRRLLRLEQARLGDRLTWHVDPAPAVAPTVPGLLVQALVENAVRHGIAPRVEGGRVEVRVEADGASLRITVADDGPGLPPEALATVHGASPTGPAQGTAGAGGGLRNTVERVHLTWPDCGRIQHVEGPGTRIVLHLPLPSPDEVPP